MTATIAVKRKTFVETDLDGVKWRVTREPDEVTYVDGEGVDRDIVVTKTGATKRVKVLDPNFVHAREPLPIKTVTFRGKTFNFEPLSVGLTAVAALELFLIGTLAG